MNKKLDKYRSERDKFLEKAAAFQARAKEFDQKVVEGENLEIRAMMKDEHLTLDELMELVRQMQEQRRAADAHIHSAPPDDADSYDGSVSTPPDDDAPYPRPTPYATNNNDMEETNDEEIR